MVSTTIEKHKKMIRTVITQLPRYIHQYEQEDQILIQNFLEILNYFEYAEIKRNELLNKFVKYNDSLFGTEIYVKTPFLWFTKNYFQKAGLTLSTTGFRAEKYYEFLAKHLRNSIHHSGAFNLIKNGTSLTSMEWELLQLASQKLMVPLNDTQIQFIENVNINIQNVGIQSLNSKYIRKNVFHTIITESMSTKDISSYISLLEGKWAINRNLNAFNIDSVFFHVRLTNSRQFNEIIDLHSEDNSLLKVSDVYQAKDNSKHYMGLLYVPSRNYGNLINYLYKREEKRELQIRKLVKINDIRRSVSLRSYKANQGWIHLKKSHLKEILSTVMNEQPNNYQGEKTFYLTPPFGKDWNFKQHPLPYEMIRLFCKLPETFSYGNLPLEIKKDLSQSMFSIDERGLLKQLYYNKIFYVSYIPWRLVYEYSLSLFYIIIPNLYIEAILPFLEIIPFAEIYTFKDGLCIWAYLSDQIVSWIKNFLPWQIYPITHIHIPYPLDITWFNQQKLLWKSPKILQTV
jgi:hypothetical protein